MRARRLGWALASVLGVTGCQSLLKKVIGDADAAATAERAATATLTVDRHDGILADHNDRVAVEVALSYQDGTPVIGALVTVAVTGSGNLVQRGVSTSDVDGKVHAGVMSSVAEVKTLTATAHLGGADRAIGTAETLTFVAGTATRLAFAAPPAGIIAGAPVGDAVKVVVQDAQGNAVPGATPQVALAVADGTVPAGTLSIAAVAGVATFSDVAFAAPVAQATLVAHTDGLIDARSAAFAVGVGASSGIATDLSQLAADGVATAHVTLTLHSGPGGPLIGVPVTWTSQGGTAVLVPASPLTDSQGTVAVTATATTVASLQIVATYPGGHMAVPLVFVTPPPRVPDAGHSTLTVTPATATANNSTAVSVVVTLRDVQGLPVKQQMVALAATGAGNALTPAAAIATTSAGVATFLLRSQVTGVKAMTATLAAFTLTGTATFTPTPCTGAVQFTPSHLVAGATSFDLTSADLDGDGAADLLVTNLTASSLSVLRGHGDGTFAAPVAVSVDAYPNAVIAADLNGDGHVDAVATGQSADRLDVLLGDGQGALALSPSHPASSGAPHGLALLDANRDGKLDLLAGGNGNGVVDLYVGAGNGTFAASVSYVACVDPVMVAVGDLDGDTFTDAVVACLASSSLAVLRNRGDGTFTAPTTIPLSLHPRWVGVHDLDGDGDLDLLAVTNNEGLDATGAITLARGDGHGGFAAPINRTISGTPYGGVLGDFNADGKVDLMVAARSGGVAQLYVGQGDGSFGVVTSYTTDASPSAVAAVDLNGDGRLDAALSASSPSGGVTVLLNSGCSP